MRLDDPTEIMGVNTRRELAYVAARLRDRKNDELMAAGVTIIDPDTTWIEPDVTVGADTVLHPGVYLQGRTTIGAGCELHSNVRVVDSVIDDDVFVNSFCVIAESRVRAGARLGPVRAPTAPVRRRRTGARRQLRRVEEDRARTRARRRTTWLISATRSSARR